jgi:hypothetical protein
MTGTGFQDAIETTNTDERKIEGDELGDAVEGEEKVEPPIEEPVK